VAEDVATIVVLFSERLLGFFGSLHDFAGALRNMGKPSPAAAGGLASSLVSLLDRRSE
jgi:hypothetical protein